MFLERPSKGRGSLSDLPMTHAHSFIARSYPSQVLEISRRSRAASNLKLQTSRPQTSRSQTLRAQNFRLANLMASSFKYFELPLQDLMLPPQDLALLPQDLNFQSLWPQDPEHLNHAASPNCLPDGTPARPETKWMGGSGKGTGLSR